MRELNELKVSQGKTMYVSVQYLNFGTNNVQITAASTLIFDLLSVLSLLRPPRLLEDVFGCKPRGEDAAVPLVLMRPPSTSWAGPQTDLGLAMYAICSVGGSLTNIYRHLA